MQHNKFIKNISEVGEFLSDSNILLETFENFMGQFRLTQANGRLDKAKTKKTQLADAFWLWNKTELW